uniref:Uncharacterized protein n=1 Tax=Strigamia maritima TaxID=126957 RepID=T1JB69_STRMM
MEPVETEANVCYFIVGSILLAIVLFFFKRKICPCLCKKILNPISLEQSDINNKPETPTDVNEVVTPRSQWNSFVAYSQEEPMLFSYKYYETFDVCSNDTNNTITVTENSSVSLLLFLFQSGLNCSIVFSSDSSQLYFFFNYLNLPFDNSSALCLNSITICNNSSQGAGNHMCLNSDLPENRIITASSSAILTVRNRCLPSICNYNISVYKIEIAIATNLKDLLIRPACRKYENRNSTIVKPIPRNQSNSKLSLFAVLMISGFLIFLIFVVLPVSWFCREGIYNTWYPCCDEYVFPIFSCCCRSTFPPTPPAVGFH